ncbi:MAG: DUF1957 domain-containing protein [Spirochaetia bacterium]|nr:DUF1957 domain-containing protein [Spirochaetia bacterium]
MNGERSAYIALVLNAHLPFVRQPDYPRFLEERWLFEAMSETYLPLLRLMRRLEADAVPYRFTLVLSPTLIAMLGDELLKDRYVGFLDQQLELARRELERTAGDTAFHNLARLYENLYRMDRDDFVGLYGRDLVAAFDFYYKKGRIDIMTSGATHAFLPIFRDVGQVVPAQVETAVAGHRGAFGKLPSGFWMPQLGWYPGAEDVLRANNLQFTVVSTRGALLGDPVPERGSYAPTRSANGLSFFIRDVDSTDAVWSENSGYPADPAYRDFYRDIGFDLGLDYVAPFIEEDRTRIFTGFKYWAVTGKTDQKRPYDPSAAYNRAFEHAEAFLRDRAAQAEAAGPHLDRPPLMVCPYDAELFGHWWFEGPLWLEALFRRANDGKKLSFVTLEEYLKLHPDSQESVPEFSSWGDGGYADVWLNGSNDWIYRHAIKVAERMAELAERFPNESGLKERVLNQAARETLLAQCSDWALLMRAGKSSSFARKQVEDAVTNFNRIYEMLCANQVGTEWITRLEKRNNLFPFINYRMFRPRR